jgi:NAD(P)-dependent dehydrogenase (short-subunit alcohol dehydrogenase family)
MTMSNKVVLITGAARGMGEVTARNLADQGATVLIVDWEGEHGTRVRDSINAKCGRVAAEFIYCDLSSLQQVRTLADYVKSHYQQLDVLINNVGITDPVRRLSADGYEMHLATCHLSHFLLTFLVMPLLKAAPAARIVIISSDAHKAGSGLDFDDFNNEKLWKGASVNNTAAFMAYHRAKLSNVYFMQGLAERLQGTTVVVNAVSPGYFVNTSIIRNMTGVFLVGAKIVFGVGSLLNINTPEQGARSHIWLASSSEAATLSGKYIEHCQEKPMGKQAFDDAARQRLWVLSEEITQVDYSAI